MKSLTDLLPHLLRLLSDEYDETSMAVFPFLAEMLAVVTPCSESSTLIKVSAIS